MYTKVVAEIACAHVEVIHFELYAGKVFGWFTTLIYVVAQISAYSYHNSFGAAAVTGSSTLFIVYDIPCGEGYGF